MTANDTTHPAAPFLLVTVSRVPTACLLLAACLCLAPADQFASPLPEQRASVADSLARSGDGRDGPASGDGASPHAVVPEVLRQVEAWRVAYNSGDLATLSSFYAAQSRYISPHVAGLMISGRDSIAANFGRGFSGGGRLDAITVLDAESSGDLAVLVCRYDATNSGVKVSGRNVLVMRRTDGRWLITTHASIVRD